MDASASLLLLALDCLENKILVSWTLNLTTPPEMWSLLMIMLQDHRCPTFHGVVDNFSIYPCCIHLAVADFSRVNLIIIMQ